MEEEEISVFPSQFNTNDKDEEREQAEIEANIAKVVIVYFENT